MFSVKIGLIEIHVQECTGRLIRLRKCCPFITYKEALNFFTYYCRLLITFANSLDPDQAKQNVGPDLDPNRLTL